MFASSPLQATADVQTAREEKRELQVEPRVNEFVKAQHKLPIDGEWVEAASGKTFETINPATEEHLSVWINCYHLFDTAMPFGGYKESGWGREMGHHALENYLETNSVVTAL